MLAGFATVYVVRHLMHNGKEHATLDGNCKRPDFGLGLVLSGMTGPANVIGFLDLAGRWDSSFAFVMGRAILVALFAFRFSSVRSTSLHGGRSACP